MSYGFFTTEDMHESQEFTVTLQGQVSQEKSDVIRQQVAYYQGVNPLRVKETAYSAQKEPEKRNLQDGQTTFNFILYGDRARESPSTSAIATLSSDETSSLKSALLPLELISVANVSSLPRITPTWKRSPTLLTTGNNFISMTGQASIEGQTCCIADVQPSRSIYPTHEQIYYLKNWNFEDSPGVCVDSNASADNVITISGLAEITQYTVYCTATDNFPLWPTLMENDSQNPITAHKATTTSLQNDLDDDVDVSFAIWFM